MLYESVLAPDSGVNIQQLLISLPEELDVPAFEACWHRLFERHAVLRNRFAWAGLDAPVQDEDPSAELPFEVFDLRSSGSVEGEIERFVAQDRRRGFDLRRAPLSRIALFRTGDLKYEFLWTFHHILLDGRSTTDALKEAFDEYDATQRGDQFAPVQRPAYRSFIEWLDGRDVQSSAAYWKELLDGFPETTPLGMGRPVTREAGGPVDRGEAEARLPETLATALRAFAGRHGLTLNTLMQGAWAILLGACGRQDDVVFGATRACRRATVEASERILGTFINTLPVRARVSPDADLLHFLRALRAQAVAVRPHEHTPLVKVKEWSGLPAGSPLFESLLVFENHEPGEVLRALGGSWTGRKYRLMQQTSFPLSVGVYDGSRPLVLASYDRQRFDGSAIERMIGHFQTILEGIAAGQAATIGELPLIPERDRRQVVVEWNQATADVPAVTVQGMFEAFAAQQPEVPAAVFEGTSITYGELDRRANRIAAALVPLGVGPERAVGLCAERSLDMLAGIMGILKAGGAYVPLDPAYPPDRLRYMLEDSGARALVTQAAFTGRFPEARLPVVVMETLEPAWSSGRPPAAGGQGDLAYIIYTSGSTGWPKGVEIEHRMLTALLHSFRPFDLPGVRRIGTNIASYAFDSSVEEIFACLCFGGTVHILRPEVSMDGRRFARYIFDHGVNCVYVLPDALEAMAGEFLRRGGAGPLRCLITGLAPKRQRALQLLRDSAPELRILNAYGPTEVTYGATAYEFTQASDLDAEVPIGRPFPNYRTYIVDPALRPLPVGVAGELLIGGASVARGYRGQPALTREKFIPDVFSGNPDGRLYRSGDLARWLPDGNIEFLGRIDDQVKIRGYRIEPGEIEAALAGLPGVERAAVTARVSPAGDKRLVAYVVPLEAGKLTAEALRDGLSARLPAHMIPAAFHFLDALPLLVSGKIAWKSLPEPDWGVRAGKSSGAAPRDEVEARLARVWEKVLGISPVRRDDNFFDLGGHSLLAVRLFSEIERVFGAGLPLATLFGAPTVEGIASVLRQRELKAGWRALVPIQPKGSRIPFFCVHANGGNVLFYRELAERMGPDQPFYGLQSPGLDGRGDMLATVEEMAEHYLRELRDVQPSGPYYLGGYCLGAYVALEVARRLEAGGETAALVVSLATDGQWRKVRGFREGLANHVSRMSAMPWSARFAYVAERARFRWLRLRLRAGSAAGALYLRRGRPMPPGVRELYIFESNYQANLRYLARPIRGRVAFFKAEGALHSAPEEFWGEVAGGGVEMHTVPGRDEDIFREPNVQVLAAKLRECLTKAQVVARDTALP